MIKLSKSTYVIVRNENYSKWLEKKKEEIVAAPVAAVEEEHVEEQEEEEDENELECEEYEYEGETYGLAPGGDLYTQEGQLVGKVVDGEVIFKREAVQRR